MLIFWGRGGAIDAWPRFCGTVCCACKQGGTG